MTVEKGKYLKSAALHPAKDPGTFRLDAILADGTKRSFSGKAGEKNALPLRADVPPDGGLARITLTPLHDTRLLILLETEDGSGNFGRLGEVGYTRQGVAFASGETGPVCIVTEGRGTIQVKYKGQTYYVCCSGCKELFDDDPEAVLAEAAKRQKAKAK